MNGVRHCALEIAFREPSLHAGAHVGVRLAAKVIFTSGSTRVGFRMGQVNRIVVAPRAICFSFNGSRRAGWPRQTDQRKRQKYRDGNVRGLVLQKLTTAQGRRNHDYPHATVNRE